MNKTAKHIAMGLAVLVAAAWGYVELNTAALRLGEQHHDARCLDHDHDGVG